MRSEHNLSERLRQRFLRCLTAKPARRRATTNGLGTPENFEARQLLSATPAGPDFAVNEAADAFIVGGDVDRASNGASVAVWSEDDQLLARRYDASGAPVGDVIEIDSAGGEIGSPAVAIADDGQFVIVWVEDNADVLGRRFSAAGEALEDDPLEIGAVTINDDNIAVVDVDMDVDGDFVVAWAVGPARVGLYSLYTAYDNESSSLSARRYSNAGNAVEAEFRVDTPTNDDLYQIANPRVAIDADGDFAIGWSVGHVNTETIVVKYRYYGEVYEYEYDVLVLTGSEVKLKRYSVTDFDLPFVAEATQTVATSTNKSLKKVAVLNLQDVDMDADGDVLVTYTNDSYKKVTDRYYGYAYNYMRLTGSQVLTQRYDGEGNAAKKKGKAILKSKGNTQFAMASADLDADGDFSVAYATRSIEDLYLEYGAPLPSAVARSTTPRVSNTYEDDKVFVQHFTVKGKADGAAVQLASGESLSLKSLSLSNRDNGELLVLWTFGADNGDTVRGRRVTV